MYDKTAKSKIIITNNNNKRRDTTGGGGDPLGIVQEMEIWQYYQRVYPLTRISPEEWETHNFPGFGDTNKLYYPGQNNRASDNQRKTKKN